MATRTIKTKVAPLAIQVVAGGDSPPVKVESPAFANGDEIPDANSDYGDGGSPPLKWSRVPDATRSFVVIVEDPDVQQNAPFTHWLLYNLPGDTRELPGSIPPDSPLEQFGGARQGRASNGTVGYFGPRPPTDDDPHHYHFEVFCLDSKLDVDPGADRDRLLEAMTGHVLAKGELVGVYEAPTP
jgi:Raf kinase inhibitor-like YbhB/YbcL family protein